MIVTFTGSGTLREVGYRHSDLKCESRKETIARSPLNCISQRQYLLSQNQDAGVQPTRYNAK